MLYICPAAQGEMSLLFYDKSCYCMLFLGEERKDYTLAAKMARANLMQQDNTVRLAKELLLLFSNRSVLQNAIVLKIHKQIDSLDWLQEELWCYNVASGSCGGLGFSTRGCCHPHPFLGSIFPFLKSPSVLLTPRLFPVPTMLTRKQCLRGHQSVVVAVLRVSANYQCLTS